MIFTSPVLSAGDRLKNPLMIDKESNVELTAISYEVKGDLYTASGDVIIKSGNITLFAQKAVYNMKTKKAEVSGGILLETGEDTLTGESGSFNIVEQTGVINNARLFIRENNFYINGSKIEQYGPDSYRIKDFKLTTCDSGTPEWSITGSELDVAIKGYGRLSNGAFRIKDVPVIYIPFTLSFPVKAKRQSGILTPQAGYSDRTGVELELPVFWAISDSADATFYERYMTKRGLMQGLELRYVSGMDSKGFYNFDILQDRIDEKNMDDPNQLEISPYQRTNSTRYWLRGRTDQQLPSGIKVRLDADVVSDQDYLKEFGSDLSGFNNTRPDYESEFGRPFEEFTSPFRTSNIRFSRDRENYSLQALSSFYQRPEGFRDDTTPEPLAGLYYSLLPGFIDKLPVSFSLTSDYDYIWRDYGQKGHSLAISPKVTYPVLLSRYLQFETGAGYTRVMQWLDNDRGNGTGSQSRDMFYGMARLSTLLERVFDVDFMGAQRLKHKIVPGFTYEYRSHRDEDKYKPWFEAADEEGSGNLISFFMDNSIDVKRVDEKGNVSYSQLGSFILTQGYDIDKARRDEGPAQKKEPFEPLTAEFRFMPYQQIKVDGELRWDHYKNDFTYADVALRFDVERENNLADIYRLNYIYNDTGSKGLSYYVDINLTGGFALGSTLRRDMEADYNVENSYWLGYRSQCWSIRLGVQQYDEESRVMVGFRLTGLSD